MSIEQVLLIVALLGVPLIQLLLRAARKQQENEPAQAGDQRPAGPPTPRRTMCEAVTEVLDWSADAFNEAATPHRTMSDAMLAPERRPGRNVARPVVPPTLRNTGRATQVLGLRDPLDLRRAIMLMTVLEPCRAIRPHESPERAGRL